MSPGSGVGSGSPRGSPPVRRPVGSAAGQATVVSSKAAHRGTLPRRRMGHHIARLARCQRRPVSADDAGQAGNSTGTTACSLPARYKVRCTVTGPAALVYVSVARRTRADLGVSRAHTRLRRAR